MRKMILTYYYVWFQGHKRSKYAHQFSHHWFHAFAQMCVTLNLLVVIFAAMVETLFSVRFLLSLHKIYALLAYCIIPSILLYFILFHFYGASKTDDEPKALGIHITKKNRILAWCIFILLLPLVFLSIYIRGKR